MAERTGREPRIINLKAILGVICLMLVSPWLMLGFALYCRAIFTSFTP